VKSDSSSPRMRKDVPIHSQVQRFCPDGRSSVILAIGGVFTRVLAKHSKSFSFIDCISVGVDRMQQSFESFWKPGSRSRSRPGARTKAVTYSLHSFYIPLTTWGRLSEYKHDWLFFVHGIGCSSFMETASD
jgi:hypothetical protein